MKRMVLEMSEGGLLVGMFKFIVQLGAHDSGG